MAKPGQDVMNQSCRGTRTGKRLICIHRYVGDRKTRVGRQRSARVNPQSGRPVRVYANTVWTRRELFVMRPHGGRLSLAPLVAAGPMICNRSSRTRRFVRRPIKEGNLGDAASSRKHGWIIRSSGAVLVGSLIIALSPSSAWADTASDSRATATLSGNVTTCAAIGFSSDTMVGSSSNGDASDTNVLGTVATNAGSVQPGTGQEVDISITGSNIVIDAVMVRVATATTPTTAPPFGRPPWPAPSTTSPRSTTAETSRPSATGRLLPRRTPNDLPGFRWRSACPWPEGRSSRTGCSSVAGAATIHRQRRGTWPRRC